MSTDQANEAITIGVEEEYFIVDPETRMLIADPDPGILKQCEERSGNNQFSPEFLRAQIEAKTDVCHSIKEVRTAMISMRQVAREAAKAHGTDIIASSVHPVSPWEDQEVTPQKRYDALATSLQDSVRQLITGGLHIHVGFADEDLRIKVMTAVRRYMPLLLALSTSSPFFAGRLTGFKSYRMNLVGNLPRTGIPPEFATPSQYQDLLQQYRKLRFANDGSEIWWDIRPAQRFPTIELRICDICPRIDDAMCIIAMFVCLVRMLARRIGDAPLPDEPPQEIIEANKWLAQRYGVFAFLGDVDRGSTIEMSDLVNRIQNDVADDAKTLKCEAEIQHAYEILRHGSSADRQIDHYRLQIVEMNSHEDALKSTIDQVIAETAEHCS